MRGNERKSGAFRCKEGLGGRVPEIKSKIEVRTCNVPEASRVRAFINAAMTEANRVTISPHK